MKINIPDQYISDFSIALNTGLQFLKQANKYISSEMNEFILETLIEMQEYRMKKKFGEDHEEL